MTKPSFFNRILSIGSLLAVVLVLCAPHVSHAQVNNVDVVKSADGWRLQVDGDDFYIKGVVWGYTPRGQNYTYNLFGQSDDQIRKILDYEFGLMSAMGVNAIRSFTMMPPEWVEYVYREHGIMSVINPLMGRYGYNVDGKWIPFTDYSDPRTREVLKQDMLEFVQRYKDTPGVLMFAFGNESNYGLSWSSFEIENLPEGEQNTAKARYLYSLWNEVIEAGKAVAPDHLFTIVNGDIQYIDLIAELVPSMDLLGTNAYRGPSFTDLWARVNEKLDLPVVFFEFGSDAFNAREFREDQVSQAMILKDQWQEMYNKAAGNGEEGNSIGAFIFEWRDEWWKYLQIERLDIQDTNASWSNQAYLFDWAEGKNNMNEEWFGITALGPMNAEGVSVARPRMAYDVMQEIFRKDPYTASRDDINRMFATMDVGRFELQGDVRMVKAELEEQKRKLQLTGGRLQGEMVVRGNDLGIDENGENSLEFSNGEMIFLDFEFQPTDKVSGQASLNILGNVADKRDLEFTYGDRGLPLVIVEAGTIFEDLEGPVVVEPVVIEDRNRVEIYDFNAKYEGEIADIEAFYHTSRFHWGYEGDQFGLLREATDIAGIDIWDQKAPAGVEVIGKGKFGGVTMLFGPEVYWGANPKFILKYDFKLASFDWTFIHSEDLARRAEAAGVAEATTRQSRQTTLTAEREFSNGMKLELGGIWSANEKVDEAFTWVDDAGNVYADKIEMKDTLGFRAKLTLPWNEAYVQAHHAGLVADGGHVHRTWGVTDPSRLPYSGMGNKEEYEVGMIVRFGDFMLYPRAMYRDNLVEANPFIPPQSANGILVPGTRPRNTDDDPFAVLGNREARSAELYLTYDPTGATQFYDWDNDWREDAKFAFNIGGTYTELPSATDAYLFFYVPAATNLPFSAGLPAEDVWGVSSRMVFNPNPNAKYIVKLVKGFEQSSGSPERDTRDYWQFHWKAEFKRKHVFEGFFMKDSWGPYDFYRQFNVAFPEQVKLDYSVRLGTFGQIGSVREEDRATRVGLRVLYRSYGEENESELEEFGDYEFSTNLYFTYRF
ncbi:MAG: hypothetical protein KJP17_02730 [Gammaproteobacteria bacterium]|nr:hypothetical protein [Gammaproteobacteria bacterium]